MRAAVACLVLVFTALAALAQGGPLTPLSLLERYNALAASNGYDTRLDRADEPCTGFCTFETNDGLVLISQQADGPISANQPILSFSLTWSGEGDIDPLGEALSVLFSLIAPEAEARARDDALDAMVRAQDSGEGADVVLGSWGISGDRTPGGTGFVVFAQRSGPPPR
jgi:hypothetical protein